MFYDDNRCFYCDCEDCKGDCEEHDAYRRHVEDSESLADPEEAS